MKKFIFAIVLLSGRVLCGTPFAIEEIAPVFQDEEVQALWGELDDLYRPTVLDSEKIKAYLLDGRRPYLDSLFDHLKKQSLFKDQIAKEDRSNLIIRRVHQSFNFLDRDQTPVMKIECMGGALKSDRSQCVILYSSFNFDGVNPGGYPQKLREIVRALREVGYHGHVMYRIGGYPLLERGGIRMVHIPYAFKLLMLIEASLLGYSNVLWLDTAVHPTNDLKRVFATLKQRGTYLLEMGFALDYRHRLGMIPDEAILACGNNLEDLPKIPHIWAGVIGISFDSLEGHALLREWYRLTALVEPAMTLYPEEVLLSVASSRIGCKAYDCLYNQTDTKYRLPNKPSRSTKPFWSDRL